MAVLNWWSHLSGSSRLCACNEKERERETERERERRKRKTDYIFEMKKFVDDGMLLQMKITLIICQNKILLLHEQMVVSFKYARF